MQDLVLALISLMPVLIIGGIAAFFIIKAVRKKNMNVLRKYQEAKAARMPQNFPGEASKDGSGEAKNEE